jgi:hypothetical protein
MVYKSIRLSNSDLYAPLLNQFLEQLWHIAYQQRRPS